MFSWLTKSASNNDQRNLVFPSSEDRIISDVPTSHWGDFLRKEELGMISFERVYHRHCTNRDNLVVKVFISTRLPGD